MSQFAINKNGVTNDVGAELFAAFVKGLLPTNGIINAFDNLACAKVNDNLVRLSPGLHNMSGFVMGVKPGTTADLAVDSGTGGYNRIDLVIAEFVRNGGGAGIDTSQIRVLKGTSTTGTPTDPTLTQEDINGTGVTRQEALYRLTITGTTLAAPELMASVLDNLASVVAMLALKAPLASPAFSGTVGLTELTNYGSAINEKVGTGTLTGTSVVITDSFIDANTAVSIIPIGAPAGTWGVVSSAGSFTVTSTKSEASLPFKWIAIK